MEREHAADQQFLASEDSEQICPFNEWRAIIGPAPEAPRPSTASIPGQLRRIPDWRVLVAEEQELGRSGAASLSDAEVVAVILFTGRMVLSKPPPPWILTECRSSVLLSTS